MAQVKLGLEYAKQGGVLFQCLYGASKVSTALSLLPRNRDFNASMAQVKSGSADIAEEKIIVFQCLYGSSKVLRKCNG